MGGRSSQVYVIITIINVIRRIFYQGVTNNGFILILPHVIR